MDEANYSDGDINTRLVEIADKLTVALDHLIPPANGPEAGLMRAMRHAALANGKRMRPFFVLEAGRLFQADETPLLRAASALECVHTYSLIHDDLPCMDNDDFRRGQPTVHKAFNEATAVLAGDALMTLSFSILADKKTHQDAYIRLKLIDRIAEASGAKGMIGGQMIDMLGAEHVRDLNTITRMHRLKTGALISCALDMGAIIGGASDQEHQALAGFANDLGLAYQITDDLLDATGEADEVGKATGKDEKAGKANFVTLLGIDGARQRVRLLAAQAQQHLAIFQDRAKILSKSVDYILARRH